MDILGFKTLVKENSPKDNGCEIIYNLLNDIEEKQLRYAFKFTDDEKKNVPLDKVGKIVASDSIILYVETSIQDSLLALIKQCYFIGYHLLDRDEPIFIRGAITEGDFFFETNNNNLTVFGPAYIQAYLMQERSAVYPRIIMLNSIVEKYNKQESSEISRAELNRAIGLDFDYYTYVNYWDILDSELKKKILDYVSYKLDNDIEQRVREKFIYVKNIGILEL